MGSVLRNFTYFSCKGDSALVHTAHFALKGLRMSFKVLQE